ncbi:hypothetical protein SCA6_018928 [Theobroma cacao]
MGASLPRDFAKTKRLVKISVKVTAAATNNLKIPAQQVCTPFVGYVRTGEGSGILENHEWSSSNFCKCSIAGKKVKLFYNPAATKLVPNEEYGIAFNGGFNQPIMCGGEPRAMLRKSRGKADSPIYTIQICVPKHAVNLIFSFTNGANWDGPYRLQFQVPKAWQNRAIEFFNQGLAEELSQEGACDRAIFPDTNIVVDGCVMIGNLSKEGGDRCSLDLVPGCMDPNSYLYNPLANVDDGSCLIDSDSED